MVGSSGSTVVPPGVRSVFPLYRAQFVGCHPPAGFLVAARWLQQFQTSQTYLVVYKDWKGGGLLFLYLFFFFFLPGEKILPTGKTTFPSSLPFRYHQ